MRAARWANLSFLFLYPVAWTAPLAHAGLLPFFRGDELTILGGIADLWQTDIFLALIVAAFAVVTPYCKTILLTALQFGLLTGQRIQAIAVVAGKLSMADIFLLALYIVLIKGVGVGHVTIGWGTYLFTGLTLASLLMALLQRPE